MTDLGMPSFDIGVYAQQQLRSALEAAISGQAFFPSIFFPEWFRIRGNAYTFVFKKNLKVTNIQLAELFSLLRSHVKYIDGSVTRPNLQFIGSSDFTKYIKELVDAFPRLSHKNKKQLSFVADRYASIFSPLIAVEPLFGTCTIFLPPTLAVDLASVCAEAGYVHSCGYSLFIRKVYKAQPEELYKNVHDHLTKRVPLDRKAFFAVYSHEDFSRDKDDGDIRSGLEDLKIFVDKFYIGSTRLVTVLRHLKEKFKDRLEIPEPGDYRERHREIRRTPGVDPSRTIWLLVDHSIEDEPRHRGDVSCFVCYDQLFHNENPFHIFDEDKPAWIDHTTLPHTLAGAMINITRPWNGDVIVEDPFAGTGTTLLECLKLKPQPALIGGDINPLARLAAKDNLEFFSRSYEDLDGLEKSLEGLVTDIARMSAPQGYGDRTIESAIMHSYRWAFDFFSGLNASERNSGSELRSKKLDIVISDERTFLDRVIFYIFLRTARRNIAAFEHHSTSWHSAFEREVKKLVTSIGRLKTIRNEESAGSISATGGCRIYQGSYSQSCSVSAESLRSAAASFGKDSLVVVGDARDLLADSCDILITDPPYGFNTSEDDLELAELYATVIDRMICALRNNGQLVFAVPDWSHIGRQLPFYVLKEFVVLQVLIAADRHDREIIETGFSAPSPGRVFRPPYYWESDRALRRAVLHFKVVHKP